MKSERQKKLDKHHYKGRRNRTYKVLALFISGIALSIPLIITYILK